MAAGIQGIADISQTCADYSPVWEMFWYHTNARSEMYTNKIWLAKENTKQKSLGTADYKQLW